MAKTTGAHLLVRALKREGVGRVFGLCGDHINSLFQACTDLGVQIIDTRHEAAAAHMADAWARATGRPGVCVVTGGPGHTNSMTGVATAFMAGSPVIAISGCHDLEQVDRNAFQEIDQVGLMRPITKWARMVTDPRRVPEYVGTAFREAMAGRPGPVHLSMPVDVSDAVVDDEGIAFPPPSQARAAPGPAADPDLVARAADLLRRAERPVAIVGSGGFWAGAAEEVRRFAEITRIPTFTIGLARGLLPDTHPLCFGYADPILNGAARAFPQADVVLILGKRLDFRLGFGGPRVFAPEARIIQVDVSPQEIGKNRPVQVGLLADVRVALRQILAVVEGQAPWVDRPWVAHLRRVTHAWRETLQAGERSEAVPIHPLRLCREIREVLDDAATIAIDGGDFLQWARIALQAKRAGHWLRLGGLGTVGAALPFGIAAKVARPDQQVGVVMGDGGMGFYGWELHTAVRHRLPIVCVVGNDSAWGMERQIQSALYGEDRIVGCDLGLVRYDRFIETLGGHGEFVEKPHEIRPALERAFASGLPACVNVVIQGLRSPFTDATIARRKAQGRGPGAPG